MNDRRPRKAWAAVINADVAYGVRKFIDAGLHLIEAKEKLAHGEWGRLTGRSNEGGRGLLSFGYRTAHRLMEIARDPRLSNVTHVSHLPSSWGTLYELTKLDDKQWNSGIELGIIRPDMERKDIRKLLPVNLNTAPVTLMGNLLTLLISFPLPVNLNTAPVTLTAGLWWPVTMDAHCSARVRA